MCSSDLVELGRLDQAGEVWRRWLNVAPEDPEIREGAVRHFVKQGRDDIALQIARDGVRLLPKSGEAWWLLGEISTDTDDAKGALAAYRRALTLFRKADDRARVERSIVELRAAAPDSLRAWFAADSVEAARAAADTTRRRR